MNIYLQAWRCSVTKHTGFKLNPKFEEKLRKILNRSLDSNLKTTIKKCAEDSSRIRSIPLIMTFLETRISSPNQKELTENIISLSKSKIPYYLHLNDFSFQLYEKEKHIKASIDGLHGIREMIDIQKSCSYNTDNIIIDILDNKERIEIIKSMMKTSVIDYGKKLAKIYRKGHLKAFGFLPHSNIVKEAINAIKPDKTVSEDRIIYLDDILNIFARHLLKLQYEYKKLIIFN